ERAAALREQLAERAARYTEGVSDAVDAGLRDRIKSALAAAQADPARRDAVRVLQQLRAQTTIRRAIRRVMGEAAPALIELKPIVLASPLSAATYLPPDFPPFDLVVIDEASQVPVWDAACALSRARCAVVVGDSKQLPPTSFFDRREDADEAAEEEFETLESVLDECVAAGLPQLSLLWHYRSRDERLIEFANRRSYGGRLQTFPAPCRAHPNLGVEFRRVEGVYDRGGTATNRIEAQAVVDEIVRRLRDAEDCAANRSIGVVTFSVAQQTLVQDLLDAALDAEPELVVRAVESGEALFVKNLESV
ncbi:MAG TPA: AAA domain-containing protein, partial [Planctomycetota bacterium]|nr:AAA domain-containing protein [Planctomycetota bacterium]